MIVFYLFFVVCRFLRPFQRKQFKGQCGDSQDHERQILPTVESVTIAVPADLSFSCLQRRVVCLSHLRGLHVRLYVTASAIVRGRLQANFIYLCRLQLAFHRGHHCILRSIGPLRYPLLCHIFIEGVAIVADDVPNVQAVGPNYVVEERSVTVRAYYQVVSRVYVYPGRVRGWGSSTRSGTNGGSDCCLQFMQEGGSVCG